VESPVKSPIERWVEQPARRVAPNAYGRGSQKRKLSSCSDAAPYRPRGSGWSIQVAKKRAHGLVRQWRVKRQALEAAVSEASPALGRRALEARFHRLAEEWLADTENVSSVAVLTSHPKYQEIISMGWAVVPFLLTDLEGGRGCWFPALNVITGIRPFDPKQAGNFEKMAAAWIKWGREKHLI
jgi:hypothetical protein